MNPADASGLGSGGEGSDATDQIVGGGRARRLDVDESIRVPLASDVGPLQGESHGPGTEDHDPLWITDDADHRRQVAPASGSQPRVISQVLSRPSWLIAATTAWRRLIQTTALGTATSERTGSSLG
jgi:hypothetical protein